MLVLKVRPSLTYVGEVITVQFSYQCLNYCLTTYYILSKPRSIQLFFINFELFKIIYIKNVWLFVMKPYNGPDNSIKKIELLHRAECF